MTKCSKLFYFQDVTNFKDFKVINRHELRTYGFKNTNFKLTFVHFSARIFLVPYVHKFSAVMQIMLLFGAI